MSEQIPLAHFDRSKPFYPLVMQYIAQLIGFKDLLARGCIGPPDIERAMENFIGTDRTETSKNLTKLLGPLELRASAHVETLKVPVDAIAKELVANHLFLINYLPISAGSVLMLAHEICKEKPAHDTGPLWEFLRIVATHQDMAANSILSMGSHGVLLNGNLLRSCRNFRTCHSSKEKME